MVGTGAGRVETLNARKQQLGRGYLAELTDDSGEKEPWNSMPARRSGGPPRGRALYEDGHSLLGYTTRPSSEVQPSLSITCATNFM